MKTFVQLLLLAGLGYALWAYGIPWIQRQVGQSRPPVSSPARGAGGTCVQLAARASEDLYVQMLDSARSLVDEGEWQGIVDEVDSEMVEARTACGCRLRSCALARQALDTLGHVMASARGQHRSSQSVPLELGRQYEQANQTLWDAYDLAHAGE
jgi:hypothetical protein